jgi:hypothetical protein
VLPYPCWIRPKYNILALLYTPTYVLWITFFVDILVENQVDRDLPCYLESVLMEYRDDVCVWWVTNVEIVERSLWPRKSLLYTPCDIAFLADFFFRKTFQQLCLFETKCHKKSKKYSTQPSKLLYLDNQTSDRTQTFKYRSPTLIYPRIRHDSEILKLDPPWPGA